MVKTSQQQWGEEEYVDVHVRLIFQKLVELLDITGASTDREEQSESSFSDEFPIIVLRMVELLIVSNPALCIGYNNEILSRPGSAIVAKKLANNFELAATDGQKKSGSKRKISEADRSSISDSESRNSDESSLNEKCSNACYRISSVIPALTMSAYSKDAVYKIALAHVCTGNIISGIDESEYVDASLRDLLSVLKVVTIFLQNFRKRTLNRSSYSRLDVESTGTNHVVGLVHVTIDVLLAIGGAYTDNAVPTISAGNTSKESLDDANSMGVDLTSNQQLEQYLLVASFCAFESPICSLVSYSAKLRLVGIISCLLHSFR